MSLYSKLSYKFYTNLDELIHLLSLARPSIVFATKHESDQQLNRVAIKCDFIRSIFMYGRDFGEMSVGFTNDPDDVEMFGCQPEDCRTRTAVILSSSGTTGLPKGVELSQMNIFASFHMAYLWVSTKVLKTIART